MFLVNVREAFGYTHEQTLNSSYALIMGMLQEYTYMCNERNRILYGDEDEDEDEDEDSLIFADGTPQALTLPAAGGEIDLAFSASGPWQTEITDEVEWIVLSQAAGEAGEHSLTVTVAENAAPVQRAAEITFTCGTSAVTFSITQQAAEI